VHATYRLATRAVRVATAFGAEFLRETLRIIEFSYGSGAQHSVFSRFCRWSSVSAARFFLLMSEFPYEPLPPSVDEQIVRNIAAHSEAELPSNVTKRAPHDHEVL
jgi:hypothetical protein